VIRDDADAATARDPDDGGPMTASPDIRHEYWLEVDNGAIWAVELSDGVLVGCHGPLLPADVDADLLDLLEYTMVGVPWIEANRDRFGVEVEVPFIPPT
jgi:hypothetical protein